MSAPAVSRIVGFKVPAGWGLTNTGTFDKSLNVNAAVTECSYGAATGAPMSRTVVLAYDTLSRSMSVAQIDRDVAKEQSVAGVKLSVKSYSGLGEQAILLTSVGSGGSNSMTEQVLFGIKGTKIAAAAEFNHAPVSQLAAPAKLAIAANK